MSEIKQYSHPDVVAFMDNIGCPVSQQEIVQVYPIYYPERRVFRVKSNSEDQVIKVRPDDEKGRIEADKLKRLFASYTYSGGHFSKVGVTTLPDSDYLVFHMPYLGRNFIELGTSLDLIELNQSTTAQENFSGFTNQQICKLVDNLKSSQRNFANQHGIIHGDIMQTPSPNNVVYHSELNRLFLVDAEAMASLTDETSARFDKQTKDLETWMYQYLLQS